MAAGDRLRNRRHREVLHAERESPPPGWNLRRQLGDNSQSQYSFRVWDGEAVLARTSDQSTYLRREVVAFLESAKEPFFLWFTPTANHSPFEAPPEHEDDFQRLRWPDGREDDVSDKPPWIRAMPPLSDDDLRSVRRSQRLRLRELLGLDDTLRAIVDTLASQGSLDRTVIKFTSDNGIFLGEHRIPAGNKNMLYDPAVRVPCVVRGPGLGRREIGQPAHMSLDLTSTCVALAGVTADLDLDGVDLTDVVDKPVNYDDRHVLYDRDDRDGPKVPHTNERPPPAQGVFTRDRKLVRYETDPAVYELYDLDAAPDELNNVADDAEYAGGQLETELDRLIAS